MFESKQSWVYGWWDGKGVQTDKYIPPESEKEALLQRRKEREALLKELERKKLHMQKEKELLEAEKLKESQSQQDSSDISTPIENNPESSLVDLETPVQGTSADQTNV